MKRFNLLLTLAGLFALLFAIPATATAAKDRSSAGPRPAVRTQLRIISPAQGKVTDSGKLQVKVTVKPVRKSARKRLKRKPVMVFLGGSSSVAWAPRAGKSLIRKTVRMRPGKSRIVSLKLNRTGLTRAGDCGAPTFIVTATYRSGKKKLKARASRKLAARKSLCAVPAGVDLAEAAKCDFIAGPGNACLAPFPNDFYTRDDVSSATGKRLALDPESTPRTAGGAATPNKHIAVEAINQSDGFSPGPLISVRIPDLDNQAAFDQSGIVSNRQMSATYSPDQPVVLIEAESGERQLIWAELDSTVTGDQSRNLIIRPGKNLRNGHRYIVAIRDLKDASGRPIQAPAAFRLYRDADRTSNPIVESRRSHFESIFKRLAQAGVGRDSLYLTWDFTVASTENLTGRMLSIRDRAFAGLGDPDLDDGVVQGLAPNFTISKVTDYTGVHTGNGEDDIRLVEGTYTVPCYLDEMGCPTGSTFELDTDQKPIRIEGNTMEARFVCNIPRSVVNEDGSFKHKARPSLYGHGLFGSIDEMTSRNVRQLGVENNVITCGTDWIGMAREDVFPTAFGALQDLSKFPALPDRLQQGFLNFLYLGRLLVHPNGLAADDAFKFDGQSALDTADLFYYGNSQGGIAGGALTAVSVDFTRSVLYVPGMNYSTLLTRSVDFDTYKAILYPTYPVEVERPSIFSLMQILWDRGEPNGYANNMTDNPLPNTPTHTVMISMAYGDHEVANIATEVEARTIGAPLRVAGGGLNGGVVSGDRHPAGLIEPWYGHEILGDLAGEAADGHAFFVWDIGPKRIEGGNLYGTDPAPLTNLPPKTTGTGDPFDSGSGINPHDTVIRSSPLIRKQIADFLKTNGKVTDPCGNDPCWAAGWQGMP